VIVDCAVYDDGVRRAGAWSVADAARAVRERDGTFVWVGVLDPGNDELADVAKQFELHPLAVEDAEHAHQRPKLERYDDNLFAVFKTVRYVDSAEVIDLGDVMLFLGDGFVVSVRHGPGCDVAAIRRRLESDPGRLTRGPGEVLYALADQVVDDYAGVLAEVVKDIDEIQVQVFSVSRDSHAERIFRLKREVLQFRQAVEPLDEPLCELATAELALVPADLRPYFRDVHDHAIRTADRLVGVDDLLTSALNANVAQVGMRQNDDMRKISAWVAIAAVPTMIAGIYGMNFEHMPELRSTWGYPVVLLVMAVVCFGLYRNFKHRRWL
jgi:magnesium transporter